MGAVQTGLVPPEKELKNDAGPQPQCRLPLPCPVMVHLGELATLSACLHQEGWFPLFSFALFKSHVAVKRCPFLFLYFGKSQTQELNQAKDAESGRPVPCLEFFSLRRIEEKETGDWPPSSPL